MFDKLAEGLMQALNTLLPDKSSSTVQWVTKMLVLISIFGGSSWLFFLTVRDTKLGERFGFTRVNTVPDLSHLEINRIQQDAYTFFLRGYEDKPEIEAMFLIAAYDNNGQLTTFDNSLILSIKQWYVPDEGYVSLSTMENIIWFNRPAVESTVVVKKQCLSNEIRSQNITRFKQAIPGFTGNRYVMCPVVAANGSVAGEVLILWKGDEKMINLSAISADMLQTTQQISQQIANSANSKITYTPMRLPQN